MLIWYNPDIAMYCAGDPSDLEREMMVSSKRSAFSVLYELNKATARLAPKILRELNTARSMTPADVRL